MKIGILGGGQLSQMLALAGIPLGIKFEFLFPNISQTLHQLGQIHSAEYTDFKALQRFSDRVDVITYENENIPIATLDFLSQSNQVYPDKSILHVSADRLFEKNMFAKLAIPTNQYIEVNNPDDLLAAAKTLGYPLILKKRTQGYDGKGQLKICNAAELSHVSPEQCINSIAEEFIPFDREISLIAVRSANSETVFYDICENIHRNGVLFKTLNRPNDSMFALAKSHLEKIMHTFNYVGVLTLEFFQVGNTLFANEMAPRVHNSGHWTIDACITSQFENHLRSILNLPLGDTKSITTACMYNLLSTIPEINQLLRFNKLRLHDYRKTPQKGRKLGHLTLLDHSPHEQNTDLETLLYG